MGLWSGLRRSEIEARWPGPRDEPILGFYARCPDGEGLEQVAVRARAVLGGIGRPTVIVTHGITRRVLCALALGRTLGEAEGIVVPQGSIARIRERCLEVLDIGAEGLPSAAASGSPPPMGG
jgi:probable phosphoglycerate mutase